VKSVYRPEYKFLLEELITARKKAGLTQEDLARILKKPQSYVSKYEKSERRLDIIEFLEISKCLNLNYKKAIQTALDLLPPVRA
jgi:transcriptional regulator with XRE-family HTH domain